MKIEKVNENQIRCTLTREDLADRQLKLSEIAYGTEKAKSLFRDMMQQANYEFGFEAEDIPLMIEAIPLSSDTILLIITKVEYPEELDTRFSKFSEPDETDYPEYNDEKDSPVSTGADDILGFFKQMQEKQQEEKAAKQDDFVPLAEAIKTKSSSTPVAPIVTPVVDITRLFLFNSLEQIGSLAHVLSGFYNDYNVLYKDPAKNAFYLVLRKGHHSPEEFNKVCNILSEYAVSSKYSKASQAYFEEHFKILIKGNALQVMAAL